MDQKITEIYGHKLRVRACGLLWDGDTLLMVNHRLLRDGDFWAPPGGGVEPGETLEGAVKREFEEETGLLVNVVGFRFGCEFMRAPLHAIELFFEVQHVGGTLKAGHDPELQLIAAVAFMSPDQLRQLPREALHGILTLHQQPEALRQLSGFYRI